MSETGPCLVPQIDVLECPCARKIRQEIDEKGFPYTTVMAAAECFFGRSAQFVFIHAVGDIIDKVASCRMVPTVAAETQAKRASEEADRLVVD